MTRDKLIRPREFDILEVHPRDDVDHEQNTRTVQLALDDYRSGILPIQLLGEETFSDAGAHAQVAGLAAGWPLAASGNSRIYSTKALNLWTAAEFRVTACLIADDSAGGDVNLSFQAKAAADGDSVTGTTDNIAAANHTIPSVADDLCFCELGTISFPAGFNRILFTRLNRFGGDAGDTAGIVHLAALWLQYVPKRRGG